MFKNALVTGASAGLGQEFARQLAPHCRHLVLVARRQDRLEQLRAQLLLYNADLAVHINSCDLAEPAEREACLNWVAGLGFPLDLVVNNAGLGDRGPFLDSNWEKIELMLRVNIEALTHLSLRLLPQLKAQPRAALLNVSSIAGMIPLPGMSVYAATKAYVSSLTEGLRAELHGSNVIVSQLCPGPVDTEFGDVADRSVDAPQMNADFFKVPASQVVREALEGLRYNRPRTIPGFPIRLAMLITAALPFIVLRLILTRIRH